VLLFLPPSKPLVRNSNVKDEEEKDNRLLNPYIEFVKIHLEVSLSVAHRESKLFRMQRTLIRVLQINEPPSQPLAGLFKAVESLRRS
jgi:hypothetical protein